MARLLDQAGETIDAVEMISRRFVYKVLPDLMGLPESGRENMAAFGHMVWATLGPQNRLFQEAMIGGEPAPGHERHQFELPYGRQSMTAGGSSARRWSAKPP